MLDGRSEPVGAALVAEREHLLARTSEGFDLADVTFPLVDKQGCAMVKTNAYSVPVKAGSRVEARAYPLHVELWHAGRRMANRAHIITTGTGNFRFRRTTAQRKAAKP